MTLVPAQQELIIRNVWRPEELEALADRTEADSIFGELWTEATNIGMISMLGAYVEDEPVGRAYINWGGSNEPQVETAVGIMPFMQDLYVATAWRKRGIGRQLVQATIELTTAASSRAKSIGLEVVYGNEIARALYESEGFRVHLFGENDWFIAEGDDGCGDCHDGLDWQKRWLMTRQLTD